MYNDVFEGFKHIFGVDHVFALEIKVDIARTLQAQKRMQEGANLLEQAHQMSRDRYGEENYFTLLFAQNYAYGLKESGKVMQALDMMKTCAKSTERTFGPNHKLSVKRNRFVTEWEREFREARRSQIAQSTQERQREPKQQGRLMKHDKCVVQ